MRARWRPPPWFAPPAPRIRFVRDLAAVGAVAAARSSTYPGGFQVDLTLHPDGIEPRQVSIQFSLGAPDTPHVLVDGPTESPHRYSNNTLCMWYPDDPRDRRWVPSYGSADLIVRIAAHLIREAWWRQTGEWIGPEVSHGRVDRYNDPTPPTRDGAPPDVP
jgi:hypothetical protein